MTFQATESNSTNKMHCVVYVSRAIDNFDSAALTELTNQSAENNRRAGISGYLYYQDQLFTQYFEGEPEAVERLLGALERDRRHRIMIAERDESLLHRRFEKWHMRRFDRPTLDRLYPEQILTDQLVFSSNMQSGSYECADILWQMVEMLAKLRKWRPVY